ncbi:hypothetical protein [Helicovermis profundi]
MLQLALKQIEIGAKGIAVAKVGEAEVMVSHGINDNFIANEIVGKKKLKSLIEMMNILIIIYSMVGSGK